MAQSADVTSKTSTRDDRGTRLLTCCGGLITLFGVLSLVVVSTAVSHLQDGTDTNGTDWPNVFQRWTSLEASVAVIGIGIVLLAAGAVLRRLDQLLDRPR